MDHHFKMESREIEYAPEDKEVSVVWGEKGSNPEYGRSIRIGNQWFMRGDLNPPANGKPCAKPDGWLPVRRGEWTKAEIRLCEILTLHPELDR